MSIFAKKPESDPRVMPELSSVPPAAGHAPPPPRFGIADAIALLRALPTDEKGELVIRVVRATLASVDVHLPDVIEDATRRQKSTTERIASVHAQMADLDRQLEAHRREIATLEADLKETTSVKERLQQAEKTAALASPTRHVPPPLPRTRTPTPEPITMVTQDSFKD